MINAIVIDDELRSRKTLKSLLNQLFPKIAFAGEADCVATGLELIDKTNPDLIFLDIQMPDGTGFDLLQNLTNWDFEIIFTTAYDQYAIDAFQCSAIGYLLKPIDEAELKKSVNKALQLIESHKSTSKLRLNALLDITTGAGKIKKLFIPDASGFQAVELEHIIRLEGDRNYTRIFFTNQKNTLSSHNLGWFEKLLEDYGFFRISKSHLINLNHVERYHKSEGGYVIMSDESNLPISDMKKDEFRNLFI
jgi:two-component system LytT family response regulator